MEKLTKDEINAIYETLSPELKMAVFSQDTADAIWNIAKLHEIKKVSELAKFTGQVLMGLLPPSLFKDTIKDEFNLNDDIAKKVALEMEHYVFNQLKDELDKLYSEVEEKKTKKKEPAKPDSYRETIEK